MELFLLVGASSYYCFIVIIISGLLFRHRVLNDYNQTLPFITVVIAARNEEYNLPKLLNDLANQDINKMEEIDEIMDERNEESDSDSENEELAETERKKEL